jgi:hypothetical protein
MTHDELTKLIRTGNEFAGIKYAPDSHTFALRAVVELHKPVELISSSMCLECSSDEETVGYPCPTIQAIEEAVQL